MPGKAPHRRGYGHEWRTARERFLRRNPLCVECLKRGRIAPATVVDHIVPHRGDEKLFWDERNWQALCKACHDPQNRKWIVASGVTALTAWQ